MRTILLVTLLISLPLLAEEIPEGKVVRIVDGDTLVLLADEKQHKIRLSDIDTPERKQPFGTKAKQALSDLARVYRVDSASSCPCKDFNPIFV